MSRGRHGRVFHQTKKKKKTRQPQAATVVQQTIDSQTVESAVTVTKEKLVEPASSAEKPILKQVRNTAMIADLKLVAILAAIILVLLIVLAQVMG